PRARAILGRHALVGRSTHDRAQVRAAVAEGADYIGFGPVYATATKADTAPLVGVAGLAEAVRASSVPVVAIGGITAGRLPEVRATGVHGWAMISAVRDALAEGRQALDRLRGH
ncbi:MAG: thiamine phosphate synthase, partial [Deltaproteobacteria bacterium]